MGVLALDHCIFSLQTAGGISHWWADHTRLMLRRYGSQVRHLGPHANNNIYLRNDAFGLGLESNGRIPLLWPLLAVKVPPDTTVFHSSYLRRCEQSKKVSSVVTFHDAIGLNRATPSSVLKSLCTESCLRAATLVHCVSNFSKKSLMQRYPWFPESRIRVIYHGFSSDAIRSEVPSVASLAAPYVLWVGNRHGYKNGVIAFTAMARIPGLHLVLAGGEAMSGAEKEQLRLLKLEERVHLLRGISSGELNWLYGNAVALWYPSLIEGFGMPVIEAAAQGCPVLACAGHSVEEIGRDWAILTPQPTDEWLVEQTERILTDSSWSRSLRALGAAVARQYSWERYEDAVTSMYAEAGLGEP